MPRLLLFAAVALSAALPLARGMGRTASPRAISPLLLHCRCGGGKEEGTVALLSTHADLWEAATRHPFLAACADGSLADEAFDFWLVQDYLFVQEFSRTAGRLLAAAPPRDFPLVMGGIAALDSELAWFSGLASRRGLILGGSDGSGNGGDNRNGGDGGIDSDGSGKDEAERREGGSTGDAVTTKSAPSDSAAVTAAVTVAAAAAREKQPAPHPVNEEYWALMRKIGADTYAVQLAAFWAIERVYNEGWRLSSGAAREPFVECQRRWSSHAFTGYVADLAAAADAALAAATPFERLRAAAAVEAVLRLEVRFWAMAYDAPKRE